MHVSSNIWINCKWYSCLLYEFSFQIFSIFMLLDIFSTLLISKTKKRTLEKLSNEDQEGFVQILSSFYYLLLFSSDFSSVCSFDLMFRSDISYLTHVVVAINVFLFLALLYLVLTAIDLYIYHGTYRQPYHIACSNKPQLFEFITDGLIDLLNTSWKKSHILHYV